MTRFTIVVGFVSLIALTSTLRVDGGENEQAHHAQKGKVGDVVPPKCPVMKEDPIDLSISTPTPEGPVYFCCKDCIDEYKAAPAKYADAVKAQRKALAPLPKVQVTCPVSGKPVDKKAFVEENGRKIYFCCTNCPAQYEKDPAKYKEKLANSYSYQTKCPVMGGDIDPKAFMELSDGRKVYFCCNGCEKKLVEDPAKYLPALEAQGINLAANDLKPLKR
jgi:YHS domain-containing protein